MNPVESVLDEPRMWNFRATVIPNLDRWTAYLFNKITPIKIGEKVVGSASLYVLDGQMVADCSVDYSTPFRLDVQVGTPVWLLARATITKGSMDSCAIQHLEFHTDCEDKSQSPIPNL
jgi:hypothetical protein